MKLNRIIETCIYAENLTECKIFYGEILGLRLYSEVKNRHLFFRCGDNMFMIFNPNETLKTDSAIPTHGSVGPGHIAFAVQEAELLQKWQDYLENKGIPVEKQIDWPEGGKSIYFRDPAKNSIEFTTSATWQTK